MTTTLIQPVERTRSAGNNDLQHTAVAASRAVPQPQTRPAMRRAMSVDNHATPFGGESDFFSQCTDELMSLHYGGQLPLLDWMGFEVSDTHRLEMEFIAYVRPEQDGGSPTDGHLSDPCTDPNGVEFGKATLNVEDFGRYGRTGPTRDVMKPMRHCQRSPVRRLDGTPVTSEDEWDTRFAVDTLLQDIRRDVVVGNSSTSGKFDGLEAWVKTGYAGPNGSVLDSIVIDWNGNPMSGGSGITWNGSATPGGFNLIDFLLAGHRRINQKISWAPTLANQVRSVGDTVLLTPMFLARLILDHYTCWSVCDGGEYSPVNLQQREARAFRDGLIRPDNPFNLYGHGYIILDNVVIPILAYDWGTIKGPKTGDMYLLTGNVGGVQVWNGQHLSAATVVQEQGPSEGFFSIDGGRILGRRDTKNTCRTLKFWMRPRIYCTAPWSQMRIQSVQGQGVTGPLSPDPSDSSFFPLGSFTPATQG